MRIRIEKKKWHNLMAKTEGSVSKLRLKIYESFYCYYEAFAIFRSFWASKVVIEIYLFGGIAIAGHNFYLES